MSEKSQKIRIACDLSERQRDILALISDGITTKAIASVLGVGEKTVEYHRLTLMQKSGLNNVAQLTKLALRLGLTEIDV